MSISGGLPKAAERALGVGCETLQIFTRSNVRWSSPPLKEDEASAFRLAVREAGLAPVVAHTCYLINLASGDDAIRARSAATLLDEMRRCDALGIGDLILHPGSHPAGIDEGIPLIIEAMNTLFAATSELEVRVLLETTAGQGNSVGRRFEELQRIIDGIKRQERTGVCVDTNHIFAAGYDIRTEAGYRTTFEELDAIVGLQRVRAMHLNDSKRQLGSYVDRHEHIGQGQIGTEAFRLILHDLRLRHLPMIIETPKKDNTCDDWDPINLQLLKMLRDDPSGAADSGK